MSWQEQMQIKIPATFSEHSSTAEKQQTPSAH